MLVISKGCLYHTFEVDACPLLSPVQSVISYFEK